VGAIWCQELCITGFSGLLNILYGVLYIPNPAISLAGRQWTVSVLTQLYTLLDTLAAVPPYVVRLPLADTRTYPVSMFVSDAASAGGYSLVAVKGFSALLYVLCGALTQPSTFTRYYPGQDRDERNSEENRKIIIDRNIVPPSVIQLTNSDGGYGWIYVYDVQKSITTSLQALCT
jgi:hypothetical protein